MVQLSHLYMTTGKTIALTIRTFVSKVMSLLFNTLSSFVIAFLPRSKCLNFVAAGIVHIDFWSLRKWNLTLFPPFPYLFAMKWWDQMPGSSFFECWVLRQLFHFPLSPSSRGSFSSVQFSSAAQSCPTLCDPINRSTPGLPVHHQLPEFTQTRVHQVSDAIQPSHPLSSPSSPAPNASQHQSLFQWVNSSHEVAKVLEFQL